MLAGQPEGHASTKPQLIALAYRTDCWSYWLTLLRIFCGISQEILVSFVAPVELQPRVLLDELRAKGVLPSYMIPSVLIPIKELPRNALGKLDRNALVALHAAWATGTGEGVETGTDELAANAPANEVEEAVCDVFASVLRRGARSIDVEASFYELGGNSLSAIQLAVGLSIIFGRRVAVAEVMRGLSVRVIATYREPSSEHLASTLADLSAVSEISSLRATSTVATAVSQMRALDVSWNQSQVLVRAHTNHEDVEPHVHVT